MAILTLLLRLSASLQRARQARTEPECCPRRLHRPRASLCMNLIFAGAALAAYPLARADSIYDVTLDTSALAGTGATLTFDLIAGGGQTNSLSISALSTDGVLGPSAAFGSVTGSPPGPVSLSTASFFNELQQGVTLGSTVSFQLDATGNAPSGGALADTFSLFLLDPSAAYSLTGTADPSGADSLLTLQIDGSSAGKLAVFNGSSPVLRVTAMPVTATTSAPEIDSSTAVGALTFLVGALTVLRARPGRGRLGVRPLPK